MSSCGSGCSCGSNCSCGSGCKCGKRTMDETSFDGQRQSSMSGFVADNGACSSGGGADVYTCKAEEAATEIKETCQCGANCKCNPCNC